MEFSCNSKPWCLQNETEILGWDYTINGKMKLVWEGRKCGITY